jgi:hypothetical protein
MGGHEDWIARAVREVEAAFPSLMYIDARRVVEIAVKAYDDERRNDEDRRRSGGRSASMLDLRSRS